MFWMRLLLYLDTFRFFGAMLVVLKVMMKESLIFFALLIVVMVGFLQAFIGMDQAEDNSEVTSFILQAMAQSVLQSPNFEGFGNFAHPFGIILYYIFTFVVMVGMLLMSINILIVAIADSFLLVLLNILIALYNSAVSTLPTTETNKPFAQITCEIFEF